MLVGCVTVDTLSNGGVVSSLLGSDSERMEMKRQRDRDGSPVGAAGRLPVTDDLARWYTGSDQSS